MAAPAELYRFEPGEPPGSYPILVHSFWGFLDAGGAGRLAVRHLLDTLDNRVIARFDLDSVLDYRARRPRMVFDADHYAEVDMPELLLHEVRDVTGAAFLVLAGPEPDFRWDAFTSAVIELVDKLDVELVVGLAAVPWPAPHTRPIALTAHGTSRGLIEGHLPWVGTMEVPGSVNGLLELRLGKAGKDAMGFAAHVPHYLSQLDHPRAAVALLEAVSAQTGLVFSLDGLREAAERVDAEVAAQVGQSEENLSQVQALEAQYDALVESRTGASPGVPEGPLPSADEIAAQVEQFLADLDRGNGDEGGGSRS